MIIGNMHEEEAQAKTPHRKTLSQEIKAFLLACAYGNLSDFAASAHEVRHACTISAQPSETRSDERHE